jgi:hypothetical protein
MLIGIMSKFNNVLTLPPLLGMNLDEKLQILLKRREPLSRLLSRHNLTEGN